MTDDSVTLFVVGGRHEKTEQGKSAQGEIETEECPGLHEEVEG